MGEFAKPAEIKGYHSRGYLPHLEEPGVIQFVTFRLADSMSPALKQRIQQEKSGGTNKVSFEEIEAELDSGLGNCWLAEPRIAGLVQESLLHFDKQRYGLMCWVIMPNHVHCLLELGHGHQLHAVMKSLKGYTARMANGILGREGRFWQVEYFDRYIRNRKHLSNAGNYIHYNPVSAGLCRRMEDWPWSSFSRYRTFFN